MRKKVRFFMNGTFHRANELKICEDIKKRAPDSIPSSEIYIYESKLSKMTILTGFFSDFSGGEQSKWKLPHEEIDHLTRI